MKITTAATRAATLTMALAGGLALTATAVADHKKVVVAVPAFLTGAGAPAFGIPSRNGAEMMINACGFSEGYRNQ